MKKKAVLIWICTLVCALGITSTVALSQAKAKVEVVMEETTETNDPIEPTTIIAPVTKTDWCIVTEISEYLVTIEYKGNLYDFYGDGYKIGNELRCEFTYNFSKHEWEVTDVVEIKPTTKVEAVLIGINSETGDYIVSLDNGEIKTISDPPEVWYTLELDANGYIIGVEE